MVETRETPGTISFPIDECFVDSFKIRFTGGSFTTTIPRELVLKLSRKYGLTPELFVNQFQVEVYYNGDEQVLYKFVHKETPAPS